MACILKIALPYACGAITIFGAGEKLPGRRHVRSAGDTAIKAVVCSYAALQRKYLFRCRAASCGKLRVGHQDVQSIESGFHFFRRRSSRQYADPVLRNDRGNITDAIVRDDRKTAAEHFAEPRRRT